MLKREYFIIYHNYYNLPVASPCLQTPDWGLRTRQQVSSSSWLQEASRSQAARLRPAYSFLRHQPHSSAASGFSTLGPKEGTRGNRCFWWSSWAVLHGWQGRICPGDICPSDICPGDICPDEKIDMTEDTWLWHLKGNILSRWQFVCVTFVRVTFVKVLIICLFRYRAFFCVKVTLKRGMPFCLCDIWPSNFVKVSICPYNFLFVFL